VRLLANNKKEWDLAYSEVIKMEDVRFHGLSTRTTPDLTNCRIGRLDYCTKPIGKALLDTLNGKKLHYYEVMIQAFRTT
jgi:hypothetical protein